jgi:hypothetical protein
LGYGENASRLFDFLAPLEVASKVGAVLAVSMVGAFSLYFQQVNPDFAVGTIAGSVGEELARWAAWYWVGPWSARRQGHEHTIRILPPARTERALYDADWWHCWGS